MQVMIFGTFDIFHIGHLKFIKQADQLGSQLNVVVARDQNVEKLKGSKPVHNERERQEILQAIEIIDEALLGKKGDVYQVIEEEEPDIIALGYDQTHFVDGLKQKLNSSELDIEIHRLDSYRPEKYKSSNIKQKLQN